MCIVRKDIKAGVRCAKHTIELDGVDFSTCEDTYKGVAHLFDKHLCTVVL
jgi:hypothetical protein